MKAALNRSLQDVFLMLIIRNKVPVTLFLISGVKLEGNVAAFDNFSIVLERKDQSTLVYKHVVATVMPVKPLDLSEGG